MLFRYLFYFREEKTVVRESNIKYYITKVIYRVIFITYSIKHIANRYKWINISSGSITA